jgi:PAS domain-containing protein
VQKLFFAAKAMEHQLLKPDWLSQVARVINAMSEGVAVLEAGRVLFVNEALLRMTGFKHQDLIGRGRTDFFAPEDLPFIQQQIALRERKGRASPSYSPFLLLFNFETACSKQKQVWGGM